MEVASEYVEKDSEECGEGVEYGTNNQEDTCHNAVYQAQDEDEDGGSGCADKVTKGNTERPDGVTDGLHPVRRLDLWFQKRWAVWVVGVGSSRKGLDPIILSMLRAGSERMRVTGRGDMGCRG